MAMNISYGNTSRKKGFRIEPFGKSSILVTYTRPSSMPCAIERFRGTLRRNHTGQDRQRKEGERS